MSRVAVVTGAASGIGLGVAHRLAAEGYRIALLDRAGEVVEEVATELRQQAATVAAYQVDVADVSAVRDAIGRVRADLGAVSVLVTSAGIDAFGGVLDITADAWERVLAVNLTGTFTCIQTALPDMIDASWGRIVTISSSAAQSGAPHMAYYAASKGGVIALTKTLARELARSGITVNTIPPSLVDTPMARHAAAEGLINLETMAATVPVGRAGTPDDIAAACAFLCSDAASYITGQVIGVNGGLYI